MTTPHPDSVATIIEYGTSKFPDAFIKLWCSLTDEEFDDALECILARAMDHLEKNANFLFDSKEDAITSELIAYISTIGLRASQQVHSKGHVDITIEPEVMIPVRKRLGEAKIYRGPKYHKKGLEQLVNRYMTGREGFGILVEYVQEPGIKQLIEKIRLYMDKYKPCAQDGVAQAHRIQWTFTTNHIHSTKETIRVLHLSCNLNIAG